MSVAFELDGQEFTALIGGPMFKFTEAFSLVVNCETQAEIDALRTKVSAGGAPRRCGWLKDKFGLSWQIVPSATGDLMANEDAERSRRVMEAMLKMYKLDVALLQPVCQGA